MLAEVKNELKKSLEGIIPGEMAEAFAEKLPDQIDGHVAQLMVGIIKKMPAEMPPQQKLQECMKALASKGKQHEESSGNKPGNTKAITREYFDHLLIEMRLMGQTEPVLETEIFGRTFTSPIMTAALSHLSSYNPGVPGKMEQLLTGARNAGCAGWVGMMDDGPFAQCMETGAAIVRVVKPYANEDKIFTQIRRTEELGALAVGMDIDHAQTVFGEEDVAVGEKLARKSVEQLQSYVQATRLPFVFKGVLSVHDALIAKNIGAKAIVLSHHGGRMAYTVPPLMVLPEIREAVGSELKIFVDCGITSGMDAYKALALGADAVSVGTALMPILNKEGVDGVTRRLNEMRAELKGVMAHTGVADTKSFDASVLHVKNF